MRPQSHREQIPEKRCGNCKHGLVPEFRDNLLCFHGDKIETKPGLSAGTTEVWQLTENLEESGKSYCNPTGKVIQ